MRCPHCQTENPPGAARCAKCGLPLAGAEEGETLADLTAPSVAGAAAAQAGSSGSAGSAKGIVITRAAVSGTIEAGSELGARFHIEALLGQGGMGRVYKAYDKDLDRTVAIKVLQPELASDPVAMQRFKQELLLASKISHRNILRIHDLGEADGVKFISMAFIEGRDLHGILQEQGRLPMERVLNLARQLCEALEAAHAEGVVHRDLKPQNALVDKSDHLYVMDFGLAKSVEASLAGMTRTGAYLGTPRYMAPEQVEGLPVDQRADIYAMGLIFYEMVTGDVPFTGESALQVMFQRVKEKPKNPKQLNPELPDYFANIIMRCLEKEPERRYQSAREVLADLDAARAPAALPMRVALPQLGRRWWMVGAGVVALAIALTFAVPQTRRMILGRGAAPAGEVAVAPAGIPPLSQGKYVALLPFRVAGNQASFGYIADGLVEALSAKLFQMHGIQLSSGTQREKINQDEPLAKIARHLGANLVVAGMVQASGNAVRVIVNLDDVADGKRLWSNEFTGTTSDLFYLEDQIYSQLVNALQLKPTSEEEARAAAHPTGNMEAYDLYLHGREALRQQQDMKKVEAAVNFFQQALGKDPNFALAYAGLADASLIMYREKKDAFWAQKALVSAQQSQKLNDNLPEAHYALGSVYIATGKPADAITQLQRALQLTPNSDEAYRRMAWAYLDEGQKDQAIQAYQKAVQINPYYWYNELVLGNAYVQLAEYNKALEAYHRVTVLEPDNVWGYMNSGAILAQEGKYDQAIPLLQKALQIHPDGGAYSNLGYCYFYMRRYSEAVKMWQQAVKLSPNDEQLMTNLGDAYRWGGQKDKANATYDRAISLAYKELEVNPKSTMALAQLALCFAKKGDAAKGLDFIHRAQGINGSDVELIYDEALVENLANQPAQAIETLQQAFQKGYSPAQAETEPELDNLRNRPDFQKLMQEFKAKTG
jgi:eukaryotic-like serine/threonine-protein kinase